MSMERSLGAKALATAPKPKKLGPTVKRLMGYMKKSSLLMIAVTMLLAVAGTVMQVVSPKLLGNATTLIFEGVKAQSGIDFSGLAAILLIIGALYAGVFVTSFLQERIMTLVSQKTVYALRNALKAKMNRVPISFFDKNSNGSLMSVASNDVDNIVTNLQQSLTQLISSVILIVGVLWFMLTISPLMTLLACVMVPGTFIIIKWFTPRTKKNNMKYMEGMGELNGRIEETYQGFSVIKTFNGEDGAISAFEEVNSKMYESGWRAKFFGGSMMPCMMLLQNLIYVLIAAIGAVSVVGGTIRIGDMQAFLQYSQQFTSPIARLSQMWGSLLAAVASAERIFDVLDTEEMVEYDEPLVKGKSEAAKVSFEHVQFGYTDELLMKDFSMDVQEGQMVAIVGHTGAGKTTMLNLLERFYEIQGGSIRIEGTDIRSLSQADVRRRIGMVLQDTWLFSGTIYDNIRYGNENVSEEQVYAAAKAAYADDFIQKLPEGYHTVLSEEAGNLSQGQRQLITIARAFAANPEILILDEATSNVDSRTEMVIQKAMRRLLKGRTSFVVAHRLSTIYDADRIMVMENGDIVETGVHRELIAQNGAYADLYNSQFAGNAA